MNTSVDSSISFDGGSTLISVNTSNGYDNVAEGEDFASWESLPISSIVKNDERPDAPSRDRSNSQNEDTSTLYDYTYDFDIPPWLTNAPWYLKCAIFTSSCTFLVSIIFLTTGLAITVYTGNRFNSLGSISTQGAGQFSWTTEIPTPAPSFQPTSPTSPPTISQSPTVSKTPSNSPSYSSNPSQSPTNSPTSSAKPTQIISNHPSLLPSIFPSFLPSNMPSISNEPTALPTNHPTFIESSMPTSIPSSAPTPNPTKQPTKRPSPEPTISPNPTISHKPTNTPTSPFVTNFFAVGERYSGDWDDLVEELEKLDLNEGDFLVHLGDFHSGRCSKQAFTEFRDLLAYSRVPVFVTLGEEEWNECSHKDYGRDSALSRWRSVFSGFHKRWDHPLFDVITNGYKSEFFSFILREILFVGVHVVGGPKWNETLNDAKWEDHLGESFKWVESNVYYKTGQYKMMVVMGNDDPSSSQKTFFDNLEDLVDKLEIPTLYVHEGSRNRLKEEDDFFWTLEVERDEFPFVTVSVDTLDEKKPFSFDD